MSNGMVDVTVHIHESIDALLRGEIADRLRTIRGVTAASIRDTTPHLMVVEFDPEELTTRDILDAVVGSGVRADLIGL